MLTTSGTHALELIALLLDIERGDEFIVPSFTFPSTANAFVLRGAVPVFIDIRRDTLNLDEAKARSTDHRPGLARSSRSTTRESPARWTRCSRSRPVTGYRSWRTTHTDSSGSIAVESLGTFGVMAAQSFHETKNFSTGEGGAIVINDPKYVERAEIIREKGTNRRNFFRGLVDKYTWVDVGSSFLPSDLLAAMLLAQLEDREWVWEHRSTIWHRYRDELADWAASNDVELPMVPEHCQTPYHLFHMVMPSSQSRDALINHLRAAGILAVFHYQPLHLSPYGLRLQPDADCPVTELVSDRLIRLPFYTNMEPADTEAVIDSVRELRCVSERDAPDRAAFSSRPSSRRTLR